MVNVINFSIVILSLLSLLSSLFPEWGLWGLDHFRSLPLPLRISLFIAVILFSVPQISLSIAEGTREKSHELEQESGSNACCCCDYHTGNIIHSFASENHLLGDGYNVLGNISGDLSFRR